MVEEGNEAEDTDTEEEFDAQHGPEDGDDVDVEDLGDEFGDDADGESASEDSADDDDDDDEASRPRARKVSDEDDDDDEEEEDVEADLDEILRGRLATEEDDEDDDAAVVNEGTKPGTVNTRKSDEFVCGICFMVVADKQTELACPMGDGLESHQPLDM
jgi:rubrerythrin